LHGRNTMLDKLNQRDKRAIKLGLLGVAVVVALIFGLDWLERWAQVRKSIARSRSQFMAISLPAEQREKLLSAVPAFEMPKTAEKQKFLFRAELNKQLKETGIKTKPLKFLPATKSTVPGYKLLYIQCSGQGELDKILDLFVNLKKNPYLVAVEEFVMKKTDTKDEKSRKFELDLRVSTFVKE